jgi:hypothetical protein
LFIGSGIIPLSALLEVRGRLKSFRKGIATSGGSVLWKKLLLFTRLMLIYEVARKKRHLFSRLALVYNLALKPHKRLDVFRSKII